MPNNSQTTQTAAVAREKAAKRLELKCLTLDSHLPSETDDAWRITPQAKPRGKPAEGECPQCVVELQNLESEAHRHVCTHKRIGSAKLGENSGISVSTYKGHESSEQEELRGLLATIEERLEILSDKNYEYTFLVENDTASELDDHLTEWVSFVGRLGKRARDFMRALKDSTQGTDTLALNQSAGGRRPDVRIHEENLGNGQPINTQPGVQAQTVGTNSDLQIAIDGMQSLVTEINVEISFIEHEMLEEGEQLTTDHAVQLKVHVESVLRKIDSEVKDSVEKVKRMDLQGT